jgi:hypothetical protein
MDRLTIERWKDIEGYNGIYQVSQFGNVRSFNKSEEGKLLKPGKIANGYLGVNLYKRGKVINNRVHRLVATAFLHKPGGCNEVNHKNEDKTCNYAWNLEWCTAQYNNEYSKAKKYKLVSPEGEVVEVFNLNKFCRDNNLTQGNLGMVAIGKANHHKGWKLFKE